MKLVSIVLLNWNGNKYVFDCINSILNQTYKNYEVIAVDNASSDGSGEVIKEEHPQFTFIQNSKNEGFAKGMNIGIDNAKGEYLLLLNNDVYLYKEFLEKCCLYFDNHIDVGSIAAKAYHWTNSVLTNNVQAEALFLKKRMQGIYTKTQQKRCFGPNGSFVIIRKSVLEDVKKKSGYYYDEDFETGWEDMDLWFRLQLFGHNCDYVPEIFAYHVGSASADEKSRLIDKSLSYQTRIFRNRIYTIKKNYTRKMMQKYRIYLIITNILLKPYYLLKSPKSLKALKEAAKEVKLNKAKMEVKRGQIQKNASRDYEYLKQFFIKF